jgi:hypothetical protein
MSAYSNLVGLYPTSQKIELPENFSLSNIWPEAVPWEPIPVHTVPKPMDHVGDFVLKELDTLFYFF